MEAYKAYVDNISSGNVAETVYIISHEGAICATSLPIDKFPVYEFDMEDAKDPSKTEKIVLDERVNLIDALNNKGVCPHPAGIRLYNQKYYTVNYDPKDPKADEKEGKDVKRCDTVYLKKVTPSTFRIREEPASPKPRLSTLSAPGALRSRCRTVPLRPPASSTAASKTLPTTSPSKVTDPSQTMHHLSF